MKILLLGKKGQLAKTLIQTKPKDLKLISLTALVILFPDNKFHEKWFEDLPKRNF